MHADIPQAFLRSLLPEDVYDDLPKGVTLKDRKTHLYNNTDNMVLKLRKSCYGLRQSPQLFNKEMPDFLVNSLGWIRSKNESSLYYRHDTKTSEIGILLLEVDDILITGNSQSMLDDFHARIEAKYGLGSGSNAVD